jgi:hypothetical protein
MCQKLAYPCYSFFICVDLCKFDSLAFDQTSFNLLKKYHSLLFFLFELNNFNIDSVGVKLLQHIFREYKYILVSFILFLTFVLTLFITENTRSTTFLLTGKQRLTIL